MANKIKFTNIARMMVDSKIDGFINEITESIMRTKGITPGMDPKGLIKGEIKEEVRIAIMNNLKEC